MTKGLPDSPVRATTASSSFSSCECTHPPLFAVRSGVDYEDGCAKFHIGGRQGIVLRTMLFHGLALAAVGFFERHRGTVMPRRGRVHRLH